MSEVLDKETFEKYRTTFMRVDADRLLAFAGQTVCLSHEALRAENAVLRREMASIYPALRKQVAECMARDAKVFREKSDTELLELVPSALIAIPTGCFALVSAVAVRLQEATRERDALAKEVAELRPDAARWKCFRKRNIWCRSPEQADLAADQFIAEDLGE